MGAAHRCNCETVNVDREYEGKSALWLCLNPSMSTQSSLHFNLCVLQSPIRRICSFRPFRLAQSGGSAADFFHHLASIFLEMAPVAAGKLARFHIEETK